jgi:hypothetical protein
MASEPDSRLIGYQSSADAIGHADVLVECLRTPSKNRSKRQLQHLQLFLAERHLDVFGKLATQQLIQVCRSICIRQLEPRLPVFQTGDAAAAFYVVVAGSVVIVDDSQGAGRERAVETLHHGGTLCVSL